MRYLPRLRCRRKPPLEKHQPPNPNNNNNNNNIQPSPQSNTVFSDSPSVHATWFNVYDHSDFRNVSVTIAATINDITIAIGNHVKDGVYNIVSLCASAYSITVVCSTARSCAEIGDLVFKMKSELGQNAAIPAEELLLLRQWEARWGIVEEDLSTIDVGQDIDADQEQDQEHPEVKRARSFAES
ncbi:hypothetical protein BDV28DRAFT_151818 [Aspergillus coremiiformis]|uniref:Uncharacterized protein n=1 Tax=Aspergillus coremiiformis TaxID=138285 RepID=A0A5N6YWL6_9EURO|nr:hypothetical protein BDV28DRAFT_151818 [Aspergillus coremiiformis]